jgi:ribosomal protein S18 acetylase RimI-like enzyme
MRKTEVKIDKHIPDVFIITKKLYIDEEYIGHVNYSINLYCNDSYIININILKKYRNKGYATSLLKDCLDDIKNRGIKEVKLNDISLNYRKENNIYIKFGFHYVNDDDNDMIIKL